jgi:hypothetical protein
VSFRIDLTLDDSVLRSQVAQLSGPKGIAYATANALNNVAKLIQKAEREELHKNFELRTPRTTRFLERQVATIKPFASVKQGRPFTEISVGNKAPRLLLSLYETGGEKVPARGRKLVGVPVTGGPARKAFSSPVAETLYLRKLKFRARKTKGGKVQYLGKDRTFLLKRTARSTHGGVFQRVGSGRDDVRMLYSFKQRPRLRAMLEFVKTANEVSRRWLDREFKDQLSREIARAQRRAG